MIRIGCWLLCTVSSTGRASALQAEGCRFESYRVHQNSTVIQLVRMFGSYPKCRGFKSHLYYQRKANTCRAYLVCEKVKQSLVRIRPGATVTNPVACVDKWAQVRHIIYHQSQVGKTLSLSGSIPLWCRLIIERLPKSVRRTKQITPLELGSKSSTSRCVR